ncbi:MAG TPA: hypothetical protein VGM67_18235 [Gemmatimonadaceae bacterium]|jgi:hypothetical protein
MRLTLGLLTIAAISVAAACSSSSTSTEPVDALAVSVTSTTVSPPIAFGASISGAGDSVVAVITERATCERTVGAIAELTATHDIVVTVSITSVSEPLCDPINGSTTYRAVAYGVPAGTHNATAVLRTSYNGVASDSVVATSAVTND